MSWQMLDKSFIVDQRAVTVWERDWWFGINLKQKRKIKVSTDINEGYFKNSRWGIETTIYCLIVMPLLFVTTMFCLIKVEWIADGGLSIFPNGIKSRPKSRIEPNFVIFDIFSQTFYSHQHSNTHFGCLFKLKNSRPMWVHFRPIEPYFNDRAASKMCLFIARFPT